MRVGIIRVLALAVTGVWLGACSTGGNGVLTSGDLKTPGADAYAAAPPADAQAPEQGMLGADPTDDLNLGKKQYRVKNYGMAERYFRRAVEFHPRDAEAWLGLAATYDQLRRFDLADRAYGQAIAIVGPTIEILNNQGYSYMLRGEYVRAREKLDSAQRMDPGNKYVLNNFRLLEQTSRNGKSLD
jgi:Flp pilus assembly protein TadD